MPDQPTYDSISTYTVTSTNTTVTFNTIPASWTDLRVVASEKFSSATNFYVRFNNDSGSNYSRIVVYGGTTYGGSLASSKNFNQSESYCHVANGTSSIPKYTTIDIFNYLATGSNYKPFMMVEGSPDDYWSRAICLYRGSSAISRIDLITSEGSWSAGSVFTLYGIKRNT